MRDLDLNSVTSTNSPGCKNKNMQLYPELYLQCLSFKFHFLHHISERELSVFTNPLNNNNTDCK